MTDEHYEKADTTYYYDTTRKTLVSHRNPPVYRITVEYDGTEYSVSGKDTYEKYSDCIGKYANGTLVTRKYDDGTIRLNITSLE